MSDASTSSIDRRTEDSPGGDAADDGPDGTPPDGGADETPSDDGADGTPPVETGAAAVAAALEAAGASVLFGVQGGAIMPVYDAIADADLAHVTMAHEQGAAHAADAYGVVAGEPGVCVATSGPGATNLVTGIADADMDSDPLVALTGQVPTDLVGSDAFQETDTTGVAGPVTKATYVAEHPDGAGDAVAEAHALAAAGRQGPTLVDLPKDVTKGAASTEPASGSTPETYSPPTDADPAAVADAARAFADAERPVVLAGGGVVKAGASDRLRAFATRYDVPVVTTMPGVGAFPEDHDLSMGFAGMHGTGYANMALQHCDAMLAVGTRFDDRLTGDVETFAPEATVVHVDVDPAEISKNVAADHGLVGDARRVLAQLDDAMPAAPDAGEWRAQCREWREEFPLAYDQPADGPLKPQFVVEALDDATGDDAILTTGVGQHQMWAVQYWTFTQPRTWVSSHGLGTMGYGLPAAIGARYAASGASETPREGGETARDGQQVVAVEGDGSFLMTVQELAVAVRENLDLTVVVLNNEAIGMVKQWQDAFFDGRRTASEYPWMPRFEPLAEAFGAYGDTVEHPGDVEGALADALDYDGPAVVDCRIDPDENVFPMVPSGGDNGRFALAEDQL